MIEEAQFFGNDLIDFVLCASEKDSKTVIVAGLLFDCYREKFGFIIDLIPYADNVTHLKAICLECSKLGFENTAIFTKRLVDNKSQTLVGGSDKYIVVCRNHYLQTTPVLDKCVDVKSSENDLKSKMDKYFVWGGYNYM